MAPASATPVKPLVSGKTLVKRIGMLRTKETENNRCMICWESEPAYVCSEFRTFVCKTCGDYHQEFGHKVECIAHAEWTTEDFEHIIKGGNKKAAKEYLAFWDCTDFPRPVKGDTVRLKDFLRKAFVVKCWQRQPTVKRNKDLTADSGKKNAVEDASKASAASNQNAQHAGTMPTASNAGTTTGASAPVVFLARDAACFCVDHDTSAKRLKGEASMKFCGGCKLQLQTNYQKFSFCPGCSAVREMCMICGNPAAGHTVKAAPVVVPPPAPAVTTSATICDVAPPSLAVASAATKDNPFEDLLGNLDDPPAVAAVATESADVASSEMSDFVGAPSLESCHETNTCHPPQSDFGGAPNLQNCMGVTTASGRVDGGASLLFDDDFLVTNNAVAVVATSIEEGFEAEFTDFEKAEPLHNSFTFEAEFTGSDCKDAAVDPGVMSDKFAGFGESTTGGTPTPRTTSADDDGQMGGDASSDADSANTLVMDVVASDTADVVSGSMELTTGAELLKVALDAVAPTDAENVRSDGAIVEPAAAKPSFLDLQTVALEPAPVLCNETIVSSSLPVATAAAGGSVGDLLDLDFAVETPKMQASQTHPEDPMQANVAVPATIDVTVPVSAPLVAPAAVPVDDPFAGLGDCTAHNIAETEEVDDPFAGLRNDEGLKNIQLSPRSSTMKSTEVPPAPAGTPVRATAGLPAGSLNSSPFSSPGDSYQGAHLDRFAAFGELQQQQHLFQSPSTNVLLGRIGPLQPGVQAICWSPDPMSSPQAMPTPMQLDSMDSQHLAQMHMMVTHALQKRQASASPTPGRSPVQSPAAVKPWCAAEELAGSVWSHAVQESSPVKSPKKLAFGDVLQDFKAKNVGWDGDSSVSTASKGMPNSVACNGASESTMDFGSDLIRDAFGGAVTSTAGRLCFDEFSGLGSVNAALR